MVGYVYRNQAQGTLADGTPVVVSFSDGVRIPMTVWVNPAAGDTVRVEYRVDADAPWVAWPKGNATAYTDDSLDSPVSDLRFTRVAGSGTTSAYGVA